MAMGERSETLLFLKGKTSFKHLLVLGAEALVLSTPISIWQMLVSFCYHTEEKSTLCAEFTNQGHCVHRW